MKNSTRSYCFLVAVLLLLSTVWHCPAPVFLKLEGVEGESQTSGHEGEIEILSWSWGASQNPGVSNPTGLSYTNDPPVVDRLRVSAIEVEKEVDKATPKLLLKCCDGTRLNNGELHVTDPGTGQAYLVIKMKNVYISSYQTGGSKGDVVPVDTVSLNFGEVEFEYTEQEGTGLTHAEGWNFEADSPLPLPPT